MKEKESLQKIEEVVQKLKDDKKVHEVRSLYDGLTGMKADQVVGILQSPESAKLTPVFEAYTQGNKTTIEIFFENKTTYRDCKTVGT